MVVIKKEFTPGNMDYNRAVRVCRLCRKDKIDLKAILDAANDLGNTFEEDKYDEEFEVLDFINHRRTELLIDSLRYDWRKKIWRWKNYDHLVEWLPVLDDSNLTREITETDLNSKIVRLEKYRPPWMKPGKQTIRDPVWDMFAKRDE